MVKCDICRGEFFRAFKNMNLCLACYRANTKEIGMPKKVPLTKEEIKILHEKGEL